MLPNRRDLHHSDTHEDAQSYFISPLDLYIPQQGRRERCANKIRREREDFHFVSTILVEKKPESATYHLEQ